MDDVLIFGKDQAEHDTKLNPVLELIEPAGSTLMRCMHDAVHLTPYDL